MDCIQLVLCNFHHILWNIFMIIILNRWQALKWILNEMILVSVLPRTFEIFYQRRFLPANYTVYWIDLGHENKQKAAFQWPNPLLLSTHKIYLPEASHCDFRQEKIRGALSQHVLLLWCPGTEWWWEENCGGGGRACQTSRDTLLEDAAKFEMYQSLSGRFLWSLSTSFEVIRDKTVTVKLRLEVPQLHRATSLPGVTCGTSKQAWL